MEEEEEDASYYGANSFQEMKSAAPKMAKSRKK
jgi:hypothetical protein